MAKTAASPPFLGARKSQTPAGFDAAIFGAPHGTPYNGIDNRVHAGSAEAFRAALAADAEWLDHWDFDFGGTLLADGLRLADLGDLATTPRDGPANRKLIEDCTKSILDAGAIPIMFGGDDSTSIPFIAAFAGGPPLTILQIDAHIDWRDERYGERHGFSSTMRRASEQPHVWRIVQAGARGLGSARAREVADARQWGVHIVTARDIHRDGIGAVLAHIPEDADCLISLDCDGLDVSQMPAVAYASPGGLGYTQVTGLIAGVAAKARIAGFAMVEFVAAKDRDGTAAFTAARIACNVVGGLTQRR
ncbi:MAG: arginase family protein [Hyphomicrobiales bacterium]